MFQMSNNSENTNITNVKGNEFKIKKMIAGFFLLTMNDIKIPTYWVSVKPILNNMTYFKFLLVSYICTPVQKVFVKITCFTELKRLSCHHVLVNKYSYKKIIIFEI